MFFVVDLIRVKFELELRQPRIIVCKCSEFTKQHNLFYKLFCHFKMEIRNWWQFLKYFAKKNEYGTKCGNFSAFSQFSASVCRL